MGDPCLCQKYGLGASDGRNHAGERVTAKSVRKGLSCRVCLTCGRLPGPNPERQADHKRRAIRRLKRADLNVVAVPAHQGRGVEHRRTRSGFDTEKGHFP